MSCVAVSNSTMRSAAFDAVATVEDLSALEGGDAAIEIHLGGVSGGVDQRGRRFEGTNSVERASLSTDWVRARGIRAERDRRRVVAAPTPRVVLGDAVVVEVIRLTTRRLQPRRLRRDPAAQRPRRRRQRATPPSRTDRGRALDGWGRQPRENESDPRQPGRQRGEHDRTDDDEEAFDVGARRVRFVQHQRRPVPQIDCVRVASDPLQHRTIEKDLSLYGTDEPDPATITAAVANTGTSAAVPGYGVAPRTEPSRGSWRAPPTRWRVGLGKAFVRGVSGRPRRAPAGQSSNTRGGRR